MVARWRSVVVAILVTAVVSGVMGPVSAVEARGPVLVGVDALRPASGPLDPARCTRIGRLAVVDRDQQRGWLCDRLRVVHEFDITTARDQPDPAWYRVYAKDMVAWSDIDGTPVTMSHFVAFTRGKYAGARVAFHSVPAFGDGTFAQPLDSVGTPEHFGDSAGCIRVRPGDAELIWDHLRLGAYVHVRT